MNGDRDVLSVSRSANLRASPTPYRKCAKGCSPSNLPACKGSLFSSSTSKGHSMYSGRRGTRSSISETLLLPPDSEKKRVVGGRTSAKQTTVLTFSAPTVVIEGSAKDDQLELPLKPENPEDIDKSKGCSLSDDGLYEHVPDSLRQPSSSEKVSKWLEESQHSTMTDLSDNHSVAPDEDLEVNEREEDHEVDGKEICCKTTRVSLDEDFQNRNRPADNLPESIPTAHSPVELQVAKFKGFIGLSLARRIIIGYLKVLMCLSAVYIGFLLRITPTSWENYEPPPT